MESDLPELPTLETSPPQTKFTESKFKEILQENLKLLRSLVYLTKKIFML